MWFGVLRLVIVLFVGLLYAWRLCSGLGFGLGLEYVVLVNVSMVLNWCVRYVLWVG